MIHTLCRQHQSLSRWLPQRCADTRSVLSICLHTHNHILDRRLLIRFSSLSNVILLASLAS